MGARSVYDGLFGSLPAWTRRFAQSQDVLNALADEALADSAAGRTTELDPDKM
jgi:hypothetical protein